VARSRVAAIVPAEKKNTRVRELAEAV